jgi:hypothetical protein
MKNFNLISRWRKVKTFIAYLYAYAIGYSFLEKVNYGGNFSPKVYYITKIRFIEKFKKR